MKKYVLKHVIYMTKLFTIAFLIQSLSMSLLIAGDGNAQVKSLEEVKVILSLDKVKIERVFAELESQTDFNFVFSKREIKDLPLLDVYSKGESLYQTLIAVARQTNLSFKQVNENIHVRSQSSPAQSGNVSIQTAQDVTVSGKVTDENGEGLPGATVTVEGTTSGTVTDVDGNFSLEVNEGSVLVVSFIGYKTKRITVSNQSQITIPMELDESSLNEVVVIGYGTQKKINLTGSVSSVQTEELTEAKSSNVTELLTGRVPGLFIRQNGGVPGADVGNISIRGFGEPLVLIDGVEGSWNRMDPNEIESISVLKDAAAAIYGARAGNGVILITTKRGKEGQTTVTYSRNYSIQRAATVPEWVPSWKYAEILREGELISELPFTYIAFYLYRRGGTKI